MKTFERNMTCQTSQGENLKVISNSLLMTAARLILNKHLLNAMALYSFFISVFDHLHGLNKYSFVAFCLYKIPILHSMNIDHLYVF